METFAGKTVAITGGGAGIGFALAKQLGGEGARVVIGEPSEDRLEAAARALAEAGIETATTALDVRDPGSVEAFADFAWARFGSVDVVINNAGVAAGLKPVTELPLDRVRGLFDVNVFGVWHGCASFGRRMIAQGTPAAIYAVGSENSFFNAVPNNAAYYASKHAVRGVMEALREEMPAFIKVGLICPGFVQSEMTAGGLGAMAMPADVFAEKVVAQMKAGGFYIVTHPYNIERITPVHREIEAAYAAHAPRYEGDDAHDVRTLMARHLGGSGGDGNGVGR